MAAQTGLNVTLYLNCFYCYFSRSRCSAFKRNFDFPDWKRI